MIGRVTSTRMNTTVTVLVERVAMHPLYKKTYLQSKKYLVDAPMELKEGDMVEIIKVRPISKNKHWRVAEVIGRNLAEITEEHLKAEAEKVISEVMPEEKEELKTIREPQVEEGKKAQRVVEDSTKKSKTTKKGKDK
ncbi:30S ribosomal protein S17 [Candidatus Daviesbacteria bacterium]|nr:30S ribosomal protein S17 [Candidatus Daviesbacteria bacterium]